MSLKPVFFFFLMAICMQSNAAIRATFDNKQFFVPGGGLLLETHISFDGATLTWAAIDSTSAKATIESTIIISKNDEVVDFRKTVVSSSAQATGSYADFIDLQRFLLDPGSYTIDVELTDVNNPSALPITMKKSVNLFFRTDIPQISSITFVEAYAKATTTSELTKSGFDILPLVSDFFPPTAKQLVFYAEAYNSDKYFTNDDKYLITYALWNEGQAVESTRKYLRKDVATVTPLLERIDLDGLPEGDYRLVIEVRTRDNEEVASQAIGFFKAGQPVSSFTDVESDYMTEPGMAFNNPDSMRMYVDCIYPIAGNIERGTITNLVKTGTTDVQRAYFENFWMSYAPQDPMGEWKKYIRQVWHVNAEYTTPVMPGYRTDRGRVWLQYGKPNTIVMRHNETEVFPYEIWHYYKIGRFNDKRFLFYSRAVSNYDFDLLHSDMLGETKNEDWRSVMRTKNNDLRPTDTQLNSTNQRDTYSFDELEDLFFNPR